jgi:hypothetical protein
MLLLTLVLAAVVYAVIPALILGVPPKSVAMFCFVFLPVIYPLSLPGTPFHMLLHPAESVGLCAGYVLGGLWL